MRDLHWIAPLGMFLAGCGTAIAPATPGDRLGRLCDEYWEFLMRTAPTWATYLGDHRYNDRLGERGPAARADEDRQMRRFLQTLREINPNALSTEERVTRDVLRIDLEMDLESRRHGFHEWDIDQMSGPQIWIQQLLEYHPRRNPKDYQDLAARWEAFPRLMEQYTGDLRAGLRSGRVAPRVAVERVLRQVRGVAAKPLEETSFAAALEGSADMRPRLEAAIREKLLPAYAEFADFLESEYRARAREAAGVWSLPGGREAYAFKIREHTGLTFTPEELHRIGREELAGLEAQMRAIARRHGPSEDLEAFVEVVRNDRSGYFTSREEMIAHYTELLEKAQARLPQLFGDLPDIPCEVRPIEEYRERDAPAGFYHSPPEDRSRPGIFYLNTYQPETRPRYNAAALAIHEAVPGHHMQIVLAMEQRDLPKFRRHGHETAYTEGWAHYAELLGLEMGLYEDDLSRYGMLTEQGWRAARLVVDTGLHSMGWPREQAVEFMRTHLALPQGEIETEVDRYIIWPGQALAYKVGQREILRLRAWAAGELGGRFDVRSFHDEILRHGPVPLSTLRGLIEEWARARP